MAKIHPIQRAILEIGEQYNLRSLTLRELGAKIEVLTGLSVDHPQRIKHHVDQLMRKGLLHYEAGSNILKSKSRIQSAAGSLISIPIFGAANCGDAAVIADQSIEGHVRISSSLVNRKDNLFAVRAVGTSMNAANIAGESIEDGDFVIIDPTDKNVQDGDYVLSVIDGMANIKKITLRGDYIALVSESRNNFPPIYISREDIATDSYLINGKVIRVVKQIN